MIINKSTLTVKLPLFFFMFYVWFHFYFAWGVGVQKVVFFGICLGYFMLNIKYVIRGFCTLKNNVKIIIGIALVCFFIFIFIAILLPIIYQTYDFSYYKRLLYFIFLIISSIDISIYISKHLPQDDRRIVYMRFFIKATLVYIFVSYLFLIFPAIKDFWYQFIYSDPSHELFVDIEFYNTRWGLSGFSGYPFTMICTFAIIFQITIINQTKVAFKFIMVLLILFSGNVMYGRIGMLASFACITGWILYSIIVLNKIKIFLYFFAISTVVFSVLVYLYFTYTEFADSLDWAISPFLNLFYTGEFNNQSSDHLLNDMFFMPSEITLMFGDGVYTGSDGSYYMHTDSGFMRVMLYGGVFTVFFLYASILLLLYALYKNYGVEGVGVALLQTLLLLGSFLIFEFKGEMFFQLISVIFPLILSNVDGQKKCSYKPLSDC